MKSRDLHPKRSFKSITNAQKECHPGERTKQPHVAGLLFKSIWGKVSTKLGWVSAPFFWVAIIMSMGSVASADVPTNVWFKVKSRSSGLVLDVPRRSRNAGEELSQYTDNNGANQQFRFVPTESNHYRIQVRHSRQVLDLYGWNPNNGASIVQWNDNDTQSQHWRVNRNKAGYYTLTNRHSKKALDSWEKSTVPGSRVSQYTVNNGLNQQWELIPVDADFVVAQDGSGTHRSVQSAINAASSGDSILIHSGTYVGHVEIPASKSGITLIGATGNAEDVVIVDSRCAKCANGRGGTWGTSRSATAIFSGKDLYVRDISIVNNYDEAANGSSQAVALSATGDRQVYENIRVIGNQDTLLTWSATADTVARQYFRDCYIEGDVDFIFGRGTSVFDRCNIHTLDRGSQNNNGFITAASTEVTNPYGFLIYNCNITSDAPYGTVYLGRPWPAGGSSTAIGQVLFRDSSIAGAIRSDAWTDMAGLAWEKARLGEFNNRGPGAHKNQQRPQMSSDLAKYYTRERYLRGGDNWNPIY